MVLLVLPQWAGLSLEVTTQTDPQPFPTSTQPFTPRSDVLMDPFSGNGWGLFRELSDSTQGNSCWCKTLAIVGEPSTAQAYQSYMQTEYTYMKGYYSATRGEPFTSPGYVPGFTPGADSKVTWAECPSNNTDTFFTLFPDEATLNDYVGSENYGDVSVNRTQNGGEMDRLCGAVVFPKNALIDVNPEISLRFNLTWNRPAVYSSWLTKINLMEDSRGLNDLVGPSSARYWYMLQGFVGVQIMTQRFFRENHLLIQSSQLDGSFLDTTDQMVNWQVYPFPATEYSKSANLELISNFQFVLIFCFCVTVALTVGRVVYERESKLREYMRMMGMMEIAYYTHWLIVLTFTWSVIALGVTGMSFVYAFSLSGFGYVFLFNFLFGLSAMSFSLFMSALFTKERMGSIVSLFVFFFLQALSVPDYSPVSKFNAVSLLPSAAYVIGVKTIFQLESFGLGVTADTISYPVRGYTLAGTYQMLTIDIFFWWLLYYYLEQVNPFLAGIRRVWYFPFTLDYWRGILGLSSPALAVGPAATPPVLGPKYETVTDPNLLRMEQMHACIKVENLRKKYSGSKNFAVDQLSLTMYAGEIYCLLGHNGAGKTTTFSMLTGMIQPTAGQISAFGLQIPKDLHELRRSMGVCPQHSVLWNELTVREHLLIFAGLRGFEFGEVSSTLEKLITDVGLAGRSNFQTRALSGGMKRKLSVAIAFVGNPKLVFLDEPTSGMDPFARRSTWDLLKRMRAGRVICISTHYMDEADVLGDRIAIMAQGKLECCGSSMFLKNLYGCGYLLSFVKESSAPEYDIGIAGFVEETLGLSGKVRIVSSIGRELIVEVNQMEDGFGDLLDQLDDKSVLYGLGVESYGISVTNIEEVFLKVSNQHSDSMKKPSAEISAESSVSSFTSAFHDSPKQDSFWYLFGSLLERRVRFGIRDRQLFCFQLLLPFLILLISLGLLLVALNQTPTPITLEVAPLNPNYPYGNFVQQGPIEASEERYLWQTYCNERNLWNIVSGSTACNLLVNGTSSGLTSPYAFQETLLAPWNYTPNPFFAFSKFFSPPANNTQLGVWQNASGVHTAALAALGHFNAWANAAGNVQLTIKNDPFPNTLWEVETSNQIAGSLTGQMVIIAFTFLPVAVVAFIIMEKEREVKNQLSISGVSPAAYWLSHFVFDVFVSVISTLVAVIVFWIYSVPMFTSADTIGGTFGLLLLYGPASTAYAYVVSFFFNRQFMAQSFIALTSFILGNLLVILSYVLQTLPESTCSACGGIGSALMWIFRVLPAFALGSGFYRLSVYVAALKLPVASSAIFGGCEQGIVFGISDCYSGVGDDLFFLALMTVVYLGIALAVDGLDSIPSVRSWFVVKKKKSNDNSPENEEEDEDVVAEKRRVESLDPAAQMLHVNKIQKLFYRPGACRFLCGSSRDIVHAVDSVSFAAERGQVFGLLGVNGAGKTTTFKMLCGLYCPSGGDIYVLGENALMHMDHVRKHVGYCPQFDALWDLLTVREHVMLYAKIRGYRGAQLAQVVKSKLEELDLVQYAEARAGNLSGGNKRKLSVAMALVGDPELVFLDEPSCGMDPFARRGMWKIIESVAEKRKHSVIILTTHSMEEAEALCSRVAIQVDGRFRCLGSSQQIKTRYGEGFELTIRAQTPLDQRHLSDVLSEWAIEPTQDVSLMVLTRENVEKLLSTVPGQTQRFAHSSYGLQLAQQDEHTYPLLDVANWVTRDAIFATVADFLIAHFQEFEIIETHGLSIKIKIKKLLIGKLFRELETLKKQGGAEDFQMSQTSLEQIFNRFASTAKNRTE